MTTVHPGNCFVLVNARTGTVLDLSGINNTTIWGHGSHGGNNQKWIISPNADRWTIRSVHNNRYLGHVGTARQGIKLEAVDHPFPWDIRLDESNNTIYRIYVPGSNPPLAVDLSGANPNNNTPVILWEDWKGPNQAWRFQSVPVPVVSPLGISNMASQYRTNLIAGSCYTIVSAKTGTVMDLSGSDNTSILGWESHGAVNQKWTLAQRGSYWTIRSLHNNRYLGFVGGAGQGSRLTIVDHPVSWNVRLDERDNTVHRIYAVGPRNPSVAVDLSGANSANNTPIILWEDHNGLNQAWRFQLVPMPSVPVTASGVPRADVRGDASFAGRYALVNVRTGTVMDISGLDNKSIIGYSFHGGANQKWFVIPNGNNCVIRDMNNGRYLGFAGRARTGVHLQAVDRIVLWKIRPDEDDDSVYRIYTPDSELHIALHPSGVDYAGGPAVALHADSDMLDGAAWRFRPV